MEPFTLESEFFALLEQEDERIAAQVAAEGCAECGGPLHRSDYERKPRGGLLAAGAEESVRRFSLCCGREGCRQRATPPSLRFLGRRVYVGAAGIEASIVAREPTREAAVARGAGQGSRGGCPAGRAAFTAR